MKRLLASLILGGLILASLAFPASALLTQAVNNLAEQSEVIRTARPGEDIVFTDADFRQALGVTTYPSLTILTLPNPSDGVLKLDNLRVSAGQVIPRASVERLTFTPSSEMTQEARFTFRAGNLSGGAALTCTMRFVARENLAPTVGGTAVSVFSTRKNASLWGSLTCYDPEGDDLTYLIVSYPKHGVLDAVDTSTGEFRYTPRAGFTGKDSFSYVVRDAWGSYSSIGEVKVTVDKHTQDITITDMPDTVESFAAAHMVSANIMQAEYNGYAVYFHPSGTMSRASFLVAAMKACGVTPAPDALWAYDDLTAIPVSARPYVATATARGVVTPAWEEGLYFLPDDIVTRADAIAWVEALIGQSIGSDISRDDTPITRAEAAYLLWRASNS